MDDAFGGRFDVARLPLSDASDWPWPESTEPRDSWSRRDILNTSLSSIGLELSELLGLGRGRELVMNTGSRRGVCVPPRPWLGGTPTSLVATAIGFVRSSASTTASTSSMQMSTFSGLRSV